jgi:tetratricopeptide (TPR) repeat protein
VLNLSSIALGAAFYKGVADGDPLDAAMAEARVSMRGASLNSVDFAVPVLFLADPNCLQVDAAAVQAARPQTAMDLTGVIAAQRFVGRAAELRELQTALDPEHGRWRAAIVHGLGGMGKTALAARLAERMAPRFDGITSLRATPTTRAQDVLDHLAGFLLVNNARLNSPAIAEFAHAKDQPLPLQTKAGALVAVLHALRLLVIFDNFEDVLPGGRLVSRGVPARANATEADAADDASAGLDPDLATLIAMLVGSVAGPSRFLFTSRVDFQPVEPGRLDAAIGRIPLSEMQFRDAVYLMETLPPLDTLPVATLDNTTSPLPSGEGPGVRDAGPGVRDAGPGTREAQPGVKDQALAVKALSMRDLHARLGGHPYTLGLFATHARRGSIEDVLADLQGVRKELLDFTLLDRAAGALPERAALLLRRAAIYEEPVPAEGLAWLLGDEHDAMPELNAEVDALIGWGLLTRPPGTRDYATHALVRDWARDQWLPAERLELLRRAAQFWLGVVQDSRNLGDHLNARHYLFAAGDYQAADGIVQAAYDYLLRWGQIELVFSLLSESARTLSGSRRAVALGNLATIYQRLGDYSTAQRYNEQVLAEFQALGDRHNIAVALHQLGILHQAQGEYAAARQRYQQSLEIAQALGDRNGVAYTSGQLGNLYYLQSEYDQAGSMYLQVLAVAKEMGNHESAAKALHQLGMLQQEQGEYEAARQRYQQSLEIKQALGDRNGVAKTLHQLGMLQQEQGEYEAARQRYQQSLDILQALGDRAGVAKSLHQLGNLHYLQGEYAAARQRYQQSLDILQALGDRDGVAKSLHQLGRLFEEDNGYESAVQYAAQAFIIFYQLGSPNREIARRTLQRLRQKLGQAAFDAMLAAANLPALPLDDEQEGGDDGGMTLEQAIEQVVGNTAAVLTSAPEHKDEWMEALGQWQAQAAQAQGLGDFAAFCGLLRELVGGADAAGLAARVPESMRAAWDDLMRRVKG